jgi:hypothetical protein
MARNMMEEDASAALDAFLSNAPTRLEALIR